VATSAAFTAMDRSAPTRSRQPSQQERSQRTLLLPIPRSTMRSI
jgi:hypothetical protein